MNKRRAPWVAELIGEPVRVDLDENEKVSGAFLRVRVKIEIDKPLRRGVMLKTDPKRAPKWYELQLEKLPFFCISCGRIGHSEIVCSEPSPRNERGKLPYDLPLRAPEDRKKCFQSFGQTTDETFGRATSRSSKSGHSASRSSAPSGQSSEVRSTNGVGEDEITSPLKNVREEKEQVQDSHATRQLFTDDETRARKRKSPKEGGTPNASITPNLNKPASGTLTLVPPSRVSQRCQELEGTGGDGGSSNELLKKQKVSNNHKPTRSAAAAVQRRRPQ